MLLVGEIRDEETARIAVQAAMTGHLVLTTLHAQTRAEPIARLKDMGIEPGLLATSVNCIVVAAARAAALHLQGARSPPTRRSSTSSASTRSRRAVLPAARLRRVLAAPATAAASRCTRSCRSRARCAALLERSTEEISAAALEQGMRTLRADGARLCVAGVTSVDEIRRVVG